MATTPVLKVLALVPYPTGRAPGQRYRIEQWRPWLRREGIEVELAPFLSHAGMDVLFKHGHFLTKFVAVLRGYNRRWGETGPAGGHDLAYVYREATPFAPTWFERRLGRTLPFVYDFDDAIYLPAHSPGNAWARRFKNPGKTAVLCRLARHVTVGNETLASFARPLNPRLTIVPSTIDTEHYHADGAPARKSRPVVGWTGSPSTAKFLESVAPALARLQSEIDFELRVIGAWPRLPGVDMHVVPWSAATEVEDLRPLDVGLMPLPDNDWARGKCGMKALQYMALEIPPVVSPVGVNADLVCHGSNGLHARSEKEWVSEIRRLLLDAGLRKRLGTEARRTVEASYSARVQAPRMARVFETVAG